MWKQYPPAGRGCLSLWVVQNMWGVTTSGRLAAGAVSRPPEKRRICVCGGCLCSASIRVGLGPSGPRVGQGALGQGMREHLLPKPRNRHRLLEYLEGGKQQFSPLAEG